MKKLFGTDGIRGIAGKELDEGLARSVGRALVRTLTDSGTKPPYILVGTDTRESSPLLCRAICEGIQTAGGEAVTIGICSTPAIAYLVVKYSFDAGVMISASHNPYEYNGIKIFGPDGFKLSDELESGIEKRVLTISRNINHEKAKEEYINYLCHALGVSLDGLKIGIDCANGSASVTAEELFTRVGAKCYMLADRPDGKNINECCGSTNLEGLKNLVLSKGLDVGIAFDGDADRCIAIDEKGREIDGDYIMAILALKMKDRGLLKDNTLVGTVMTNLGLKRFCEENKIQFQSASVGDRYVLEMMNNGGFSLGGEQSGHIILRKLATTGDGQLTALALLSHIKESGKSLSTLADVMKKYPQVTININASDSDKQALAADKNIKQIIAEFNKKVEHSGRILIRPSGTEALIRIMVEEESLDEAQKTAAALAGKIQERLCELNRPVR